MSTPRSTFWPTTSKSTSIATACSRWLKPGKAEQDRQQPELHTAGRAIEHQRSADVGGGKCRATLAHPVLVDQLAVIGARPHQPYAERAGHRRFRPAGIGRVVPARVAP